MTSIIHSETYRGHTFVVTDDKRMNSAKLIGLGNPQIATYRKWEGHFVLVWEVDGIGEETSKYSCERSDDGALRAGLWPLSECIGNAKAKIDSAIAHGVIQGAPEERAIPKNSGEKPNEVDLVRIFLRDGVGLQVQSNAAFGDTLTPLDIQHILGGLAWSLSKGDRNFAVELLEGGKGHLAGYASPVVVDAV